MNGFRVTGHKKKELLDYMNLVANIKVKEGVNVRAWMNKVHKIDSKKVPHKFTTKQLTGLISQLKAL